MDKDYDIEIDNLINSFVPPENMELIGILTIILPSILPEMKGGQVAEEVTRIDWNLHPEFYTYVFGRICGNPATRGTISTQLQRALQANFSEEELNFFVRSDFMGPRNSPTGACFYFCQRNPNEPGTNVRQADQEQIFHLTIHLIPATDNRRNPIPCGKIII